MNDVHKYSKDWVSVMITLGTYVIRGDTVFYDGIIRTYLVKRDHILKHLHGRIIMGPYERIFREGCICRGHKSVIYFILRKHFFVHFICRGDWFYNQYIKSKIRTKYLDHDGMGC